MLRFFLGWQLTGEVILVHRGNCSFTTKTKVAEAAGASAILIINNSTGNLLKFFSLDIPFNYLEYSLAILLSFECCFFADLFKMVCEKGENVLDINIPVVMLPIDAGRSLEETVQSNSIGNSQFASSSTSPEIGLFRELLLSSSFLYFFSSVVVECICSVTLQLYSPKRPAVDVAEVFLWLMAVGTILCASYWSAWTAREEAIEQDKLLKVH